MCFSSSRVLVSSKSITTLSLSIMGSNFYAAPPVLGILLATLLSYFALSFLLIDLHSNSNMAVYHHSVFLYHSWSLLASAWSLSYINSHPEVHPLSQLYSMGLPSPQVPVVFLLSFDFLIFMAIIPRQKVLYFCIRLPSFSPRVCFARAYVIFIIAAK
jgi:hypothetical protein